MIDLSFALQDLEYFLLILVRVTSFIFVAPFYGTNNTPNRVKIGFGVFVSIILYQVLTPSELVEYRTVIGYAAIVIKEAVVGLLIGYGASICTTIVSFAGSIIDMEAGLSMATLIDPATRENVSISGVLYQYAITLMLMITGMYEYIIRALAETYQLIPVNGAVFSGESLLNSMVQFMMDYVIIGFRICLPVFVSMVLLNAVLGIMAKVSPQMNMFAVGIQLKVLVGLCVIFLAMSMLPSASNMIYNEMRRMVVAFVEGMISV